jgi:hypothetical protein
VIVVNNFALLLLQRRILFFGASLLASSVVAVEPISAATAICGGVRIPIDISVFNKPFANMTLGGNRGYFLIDTGATLSQIDMRRFAVPEGIKIMLSGFSLPSAEGGVFTAADLSSFAAPVGPQLGTIGTDFLSLRTIQFHYEQSQSFAALEREACDQVRLREAGFAAIGLPGYYGADLSPLKRGMPNVPVIRLRIGEVTFPAQVDTGYGDFPRGVIQVNAALLKTLRVVGIPLHSLPSDVITLGCSGVFAYERWQTEVEKVSIISSDGRVVTSYPPPLLELKTDVSCSGISTFDEPFAQIGAFWLSRWETSIFDGLNSTVWIPQAHRD